MVFLICVGFGSPLRGNPPSSWLEIRPLQAPPAALPLSLWRWELVSTSRLHSHPGVREAAFYFHGLCLGRFSEPCPVGGESTVSDPGGSGPACIPHLVGGVSLSVPRLWCSLWGRWGSPFWSRGPPGKGWWEKPPPHRPQVEKKGASESDPTHPQPS